MKKSTQIFEFDERKRERYFFFIFEFSMMKEKNMKKTQCMKVMDQNNECMQECYECQDEHQEHFEDHDEHQEHIFEKFLMQRKHARHQT